jgi:predicted component of type VI protein secretion system
MGAAPGAMGATCPQCSTPLPAGAVFCDNCGAPVEQAAQQQYQQPAQQQYQQPAQQQYQQPGPQAVSGASPRLVMQASGTQIPLPPGKMEYLVGREDPVSNTFPDVDMSLHGGDEGGVSRRHARLYQQGGQWFVEDYGSTNFTFVNNQKVLPNAPLPVQDGAELRFGRIKVTFHVQ